MVTALVGIRILKKFKLQYKYLKEKEKNIYKNINLLSGAVAETEGQPG